MSGPFGKGPIGSTTAPVATITVSGGDYLPKHTVDEDTEVPDGRSYVVQGPLQINANCALTLVADGRVTVL